MPAPKPSQADTLIEIFRRDGFVHVEGVLTDEEVARIRAASPRG